MPLFLISFVIEAAWKKEPGHSKQRQSRGSPSYLTKYFHRNLVHLHGRRPRKQVHTVEMTVPNPPKKDILLPQSLCMRDATPVVNMSRTDIHYDCKKQSHVGGAKPHLADTRSRAPLSAVMAVAYALCGWLYPHICPQNRYHTYIREAFRSRAVCAAF